MAPHATYVQVAFLELEKARHEKEIEAGQSRLRALGARVRQIEVKKAALLGSMARQEGNGASGGGEAGKDTGPAGIELRY